MAGRVSVCIPGQPVLTEWVQISESHYSLNQEILNPAAVTELAFFVMPGENLPPGYGALLHFSCAPYVDWEILGGIGPGRPSGIFRTGWHERFNASTPPLRLGLSLEPLERLANLDISTKGVEDRLAYAQKIAADLFNYMSSFSQSTQPGLMAVPFTIFDDWMKRFERKYRIDPTFFLK